jgi:hypothetical protein
MNKRELNGKSPNRHGKYVGDTRYEKVWEQMQLLGIKDITTARQYKNGTIVWRLPIKNNYPGNKDNFIEVASFDSGYVRNQNSGYSNYQLNKRCDGEPQYFQLGDKDNCGVPLYRKWTTRTCKLIPIEIDRLEYLIKYCVKNYYIKHANQVSDGKFVPEWMYENYKNEYKNRANEVNKMDAKQEQLINKIERIKTFLRHELL